MTESRRIAIKKLFGGMAAGIIGIVGGKQAQAAHVDGPVLIGNERPLPSRETIAQKSAVEEPDLIYTIMRVIDRRIIEHEQKLHSLD